MDEVMGIIKTTFLAAVNIVKELCLCQLYFQYDTYEQYSLNMLKIMSR